MWCRSSDTPSVIAAHQYMFSSWPTQIMKTRAVSLHVKSRIHLGFCTGEDRVGNVRLLNFVVLVGVI